VILVAVGEEGAVPMQPREATIDLATIALEVDGEELVDGEEDDEPRRRRSGLRRRLGRGERRERSGDREGG
jgi:hypothetical protein